MDKIAIVADLAVLLHVRHFQAAAAVAPGLPGTEAALKKLSSCVTKVSAAALQVQNGEADAVFSLVQKLVGYNDSCVCGVGCEMTALRFALVRRLKELLA
jgi:hypothetical protein